MFRTRRGALVRRLWRSRLIADGEEADGGSKSCEDPENISRTEPTPVGNSGGSSDTLALVESVGSELVVEQAGIQVDMCVQEQRGLPPSEDEEESEGRTVTCCWFKDLHRSKSDLSDSWQVRDHGVSAAADSRTRRTLLEQELHRCAYALLKSFKEKPLGVLLESVESKGAVMAGCVAAPQAELHVGGRAVSPQYLLCRFFRWPDLQLSSPLKALCCCQSFRAPGGEAPCCNPYHYSRLCGPDSPPPPYSQLSPKLGQESLGYTALLRSPPPLIWRCWFRLSYTNSSPSSLGRKHWCNVAYWEHRTRVGRLYPVYDSSLSIFYDLPQGTGLCLGLLPNMGRASSSVQRARAKIGHGILLSREADGVWAYNRSQHPIFINSPTLEHPRCRSPTVTRVMPDYSVKIFDYEKSCQIGHLAHTEGPYDPNSVRISFAKGWGPCYSRQFVTSCPCWLEILLNNHR
ncbi:SMAD family member 6a, partial [Silurus asotus]